MPEEVRVQKKGGVGGGAMGNSQQFLFFAPGTLCEAAAWEWMSKGDDIARLLNFGAADPYDLAIRYLTFYKSLLILRFFFFCAGARGR